MTDILMSIKPRYADMIVSGRKTVEIRKRTVRALAGARIWIYATSPRQQIVAFARLKAVAAATPAEIWGTFGDRTGIDRTEFDAYVGEAEVVSALCLTEVTSLDPPLCPRHEAPAFRPPQSYAFLHDTRFLATLETKAGKKQPTDERPPPSRSDLDGGALSAA